MKYNIFLIFISAWVYGCNPSSDSSQLQEDQNTLVQKKGELVESSCYTYDQNGNHVHMHITEIAQDSIIGTLNIAYAEKDASQGTFTGVLKGDKLLATYTFNSEGTESKREVAYMVQGEQLVEGYGEMNEEGTEFKDKNSIKYTSTMPLLKVECE